MPAVLYFFSLCNLVIGSGAFVLGGILEPMSQSLGVSVGAAGQAMTAYAVSTAVLAPVLIIGTAQWSRRRAVQLALALFMLGCAVCAMAPTLAVLMVGRVLMGAGAMFTATAAALAVGLVAPAQRGRALSLSFLGISISYAVGVPIGAWLGFEYGWRVPVWGAAGASALALLASCWLVPAQMMGGGGGFSGFRSAAGQGAVLRVWLRTLLYFIAIFSVFTYVGPVLRALNPLTPTALSLTLAMFGLSGVAGTVIGGWATDRFGPLRTLRWQLGILLVMMVLLPLTQGHVAATSVTLVVWGTAGFGMMAPQQSRLASLSGAQAPLLLSLNSSMLYVGTALGALISGSLIGHLSLHELSWVGLPFAALAMGTLWFDRASATPTPSAHRAS